MVDGSYTYTFWKTTTITISRISSWACLGKNTWKLACPLSKDKRPTVPKLLFDAYLDSYQLPVS